MNTEQENYQEENAGSIFDTPIQIQNDEDGESIKISENFDTTNFDNDYQEEDDEQPDNQENEEEDFEQEEGVEGDPLDDVDFGDELTKIHAQRESEEEDKFNENDAIEKLKALGYNVDKASTPENEDKLEINRLNDLISRGNDFLNLSDLEVVKRKVKSDLSQKYIDSGRQHLIGTEDFENEFEEEMLDYEDNPKLLQMFASNVRRDVRDNIKEYEEDKGKITNKITQREQQQLAQNRLKLQDSIKTMLGNKNGFLGIQLSVEDSKEIYNSITSGKFTKQVNSDPNLVAEFAAFIRFRDQIKERIGGPSFGEGVKAAVDAMTGNKGATKSSLGTMMASPSSKNDGRSRKSWAMPTISDEELDKSTKVVGKVQLY